MEPEREVLLSLVQAEFAWAVQCRVRLDNVNELRNAWKEARQQTEGDSSSPAGPGQARKRKRAIDVLEASSDESGSDDADEADELLDWRAKTV